MKILMITHFVPYPPTSGALQRNYNLLREVARHHEVNLVTLNQKALLPSKEKLADAIKNITPFCKTIKVFPIPSDCHPACWYILLLANIFSTTPYSVWRFYSNKMAKEIQKIIKTSQIDVIHVDTIDLAGYALNITTHPRVLNHHNIESELLFRRAQHAKNPFSRWYLTSQARKVERYEKQYVPKFDANVAVSTRDLIGIRSLCNPDSAMLVANGTDTDYFSPSGTSQELSCIFAGGLNWLPNADAMLFFCTSIFPLIKANVPEVTMTIIGTNPAPELIRIAEKTEGIEVLGFVPDIRSYMANAAVHVVPLRIGGGTRLKILDALAMGKAIVSTTIGAEGIELTDGHDIMIADTAELFAQKVVQLLKDAALRKTLGVNGRKTAETKYSWKVIGPKLIDAYSHVCRNTGSGGKT
jgi:polysaccharide biosynthesis protein PslH